MKNGINKREVAKILSMGLSNDIETLFLVEELLKVYIDYTFADYLQGYYHILYPLKECDYVGFSCYIFYIRNKFFSDIRYSPYSKKI